MQNVLSIMKSKFMMGIESYLLGAWLVVSPYFLQYALNFDYSKLGLDPTTLKIVGGVILLVRMKDSFGEAPAVTLAKSSGLTGSEVAGPNAANK